MSTLAITDNANGTGALATIAGSSGGANTVYVQQVTGLIGSGSFASGGTRTGDGTVALALANGYYFAYCLTAPSTLSGQVYFTVTDGLLAVVDRVYAGAVAQIQLLNKTYTQRVYDYSETADPSVTYPCTLLSTQDGRQTNEMAMNGRDDWGYPVRVFIRDVVVQFDESAKQRFRLWRQQVTRAFVNQRMPGLAESIICRVEPGELFRRVKDGKPNVMETELVVRAVTREVRGLGA